MKRTILMFMVLALCAASSCSTKKVSPVEEAITARLREMTPGIKSVNYQSLEAIDTVTLGKELDYREKLFKVKCDVIEKKFQKYAAAGDYGKATAIAESINNDRRIYEGIGKLRENLKDSLDKVVYYDYKFSAIIDTENGRITVQDYYAVVSPDMKVLKYSQQSKGIHNGLGGVIPGYMELLDGAGE